MAESSVTVAGPVVLLPKTTLDAASVRYPVAVPVDRIDQAAATGCHPRVIVDRHLKAVQAAAIGGRPWQIEETQNAGEFEVRLKVSWARESELTRLCGFPGIVIVLAA